MTLFRHVLSPIDLSSRSRHTAVHAAAIARSCNATFTLLHVLPARPPGPDTERRKREAQAALDDIAEDVRTRWPARTALCEGDSRDEVRTYALDHGADLLVVGSRHRPFLERLFLESVGERLTTAGAWSVLAVPDPDEEARRPPANHWEILCAVDLAETSQGVIKTAAALARAKRAHLTVLHTIDLARWYAPEALLHGDEEALRRQETQSARARISRLLAAETGPVLDVDVLVSFGPADEEILRIAAATRAETLVTGAHSNGMVGDISLGPTAASLLRHAPCPLLLVRLQPTPAPRESEDLRNELVAPI